MAPASTFRPVWASPRPPPRHGRQQDQRLGGGFVRVGGARAHRAVPSYRRAASLTGAGRECAPPQQRFSLRAGHRLPLAPRFGQCRQWPNTQFFLGRTCGPFRLPRRAASDRQHPHSASALTMWRKNHARPPAPPCLHLSAPSASHGLRAPRFIARVRPLASPCVRPNILSLATGSHSPMPNGDPHNTS